MLDLNHLTAIERAIYNQTLAGSYEFKITVQVLTNQHQVISTVSHILIDGQVDAEAVVMRDGDVAVSRHAKLQFLDPAHSLAFDSTSPADGALYLDRMLRIICSVRCSFGWVDVPLFTGPVTDVSRDGDFVDVDADGKEVFGLRAAWEAYTYSKGYKVDTVRGLLVRSGELTKYIQLPPSREKLTSPVVLARETSPWPKAFALMGSMSQILFYDARGIVRTTPRSTKPVIEFRTGDGGLILSEPQTTFSTGDLKNAAIVRGGRPRGAKRAVYALVVAPRSHSLSPYKIGRDPETGRGGWLTVTEENDDIRTTTKAVQVGKKLLDDGLRQGTEATWDSLPVWHLEPWDMAGLVTESYSTVVRVRKFSLPLRADADMTVGYTRDLTKPRRYVRSA